MSGGVTVVIPVWGAYVAHLDAALASIAAQDAGAVDVVVVDNANDPPLAPLAGARVVRSDVRLPLGAARNLGVAHAREDLVVMWDADDEMAPGALARLVETLRRRPELVAHGLGIVDVPGGTRHRWPRRRALRLRRHPRLFALLNCVWSTYPTTGATVMRTTAVRDCGGFSAADSGDDWALGALLLLRGPVGWEEQPGRLYRATPDSIWARHRSVAHLLRHAAVVRRRLAADVAAPVLLRRCAPALALPQWLLVLCALPVRAQRQARTVYRSLRNRSSSTLPEPSGQK